MTNRYIFLQIATLVALIICFTSTSRAQSVLTDDATTINSPKDADANFGTNPNLNVSSTSNTYLKFNPSTTLPAGTRGADLGKATLRLYVGIVQSSGTIDLYQAGGAWSEKTVTANTAPAVGVSIIAGIQIDVNNKGQYLNIDVTAMVRNWLDGAVNNGIVIVAGASTNVTFDSKENAQTSHEPALTLMLKAGAGSTPNAAIFRCPSQRVASTLTPGPLCQLSVPKARR
jgi:hypothetical protein